MILVFECLPQVPNNILDFLGIWTWKKNAYYNNKNNKNNFYLRKNLISRSSS